MGPRMRSVRSVERGRRVSDTEREVPVSAARARMALPWDPMIGPSALCGIIVRIEYVSSDSGSDSLFSIDSPWIVRTNKVQACIYIISKISAVYTIIAKNTHVCDCFDTTADCHNSFRNTLYVIAKTATHPAATADMCHISTFLANQRRGLTTRD